MIKIGWTKGWILSLQQIFCSLLVGKSDSILNMWKACIILSRKKKEAYDDLIFKCNTTYYLIIVFKEPSTKFGLHTRFWVTLNWMRLVTISSIKCINWRKVISSNCSASPIRKFAIFKALSSCRDGGASGRWVCACMCVWVNWCKGLAELSDFFPKESVLWWVV